MANGPAAAGPNDVALRTRFGSARNAFITQAEQKLRVGSDGLVSDQDFAMGRDPEFWAKADGDSVVRGARDYARHLVAAPRLVLEPRSPADAELVPYYDAMVNRIRRFTSSMFGLADSRFRGLAVARMLGGHKEVDLLGDGNTRRWFLVNELRCMPKGRWSKRRWVEEDKQFEAWSVWDWTEKAWILPDNPDWYVFHSHQDTEDQLYGRDLGRPLYWLLYAKNILWESALDTSERFGSPWIKGTLPPAMGGVSLAGGSDLSQFRSQANTLLTILGQLRQHNILVADERIKTELVEGGLRGAEFVMKLIEKIDHEIRILLLGSNLPTSATAGGSFALAQVQDESTRRLISFYRRLLEEDITDQLLERLHEWNRPIFETIPAKDGRGTLADRRPPRLQIADEEVFELAEREGALRMMKDTGSVVRKSDLYAATRGVFKQPAEGDEIIDLGAQQESQGFSASPVWRGYAEGDWGQAG